MTAIERAEGEWGGKENTGGGLSPDPAALTDEELGAALDALCIRRDSLLERRAAMDLPTVVVYAYEETPPVGTRDGDIIAVGDEIFRLQTEWVTRENARIKATKGRDPD